MQIFVAVERREFKHAKQVGLSSYWGKGFGTRPTGAVFV
jgi:hypothetical protein